MKYPVEPHVYDMDGVCSDFVWSYTNQADLLFPGRVPAYGTGYQPAWYRLNEAGYLTADEDNELWKSITHSDHFWMNLESLATWSDHYHMDVLAKTSPVIYCTTRRGRRVKWQTERWLERHRFPQGEVIVAHNKAEALLKAGVPLGTPIIEDNPSNIFRLQQAGFDLYIRDWAFNRGLTVETEGSPLVLHPDEWGTRVSSIAEFCRLVTEKRACET